jgi:hypothetical protein
MKFQNISIPEEQKELLQSVKWNLWQVNCDKALDNLTELMKIEEITKDKSLSAKLSKLLTYISNNKAGIVNYEQRKIRDLCLLVI